jgi:hypothetical protein
VAQLRYLDRDGLAELGDGTKWRIAYDHLPTTQLWLNGAEISAKMQPQGSMWPYTLTYEPTGEIVSASRSPAPMDPLTYPPRTH